MQDLFDKHNPVIKMLYLNRQNVLEELMDLHRNEAAMGNHGIEVYFNDEAASRDGEAGEAYSLFLE